MTNKYLSKLMEKKTSLELADEFQKMQTEIQQLKEEKEKFKLFLQSRIRDAFNCIEHGVWEHYPFDSHSRDGIYGMKDGYSDVLKELNKPEK